jgi:hypothetical protein
MTNRWRESITFTSLHINYVLYLILANIEYIILTTYNTTTIASLMRGRKYMASNLYILKLYLKMDLAILV